MYQLVLITKGVINTIIGIVVAAGGPGSADIDGTKSIVVEWLRATEDEAETTVDIRACMDRPSIGFVRP